MTVFAIAENFYIYRKTYSPVKAGLISSAQQGHPPFPWSRELRQGGQVVRHVGG